MAMGFGFPKKRGAKMWLKKFRNPNLRLSLVIYLSILAACQPSHLKSRDLASVTEHPLAPKIKNLNFTTSIADSTYLASLFTDNFGPDAKTVIDVNINPKNGDLGGPCSIYSHYLVKKTDKYIDPNSALSCTSEKMASLLLPPPQAIRQGWIIQTCASLVGKNNQPKTLDFVLGRIQTGAKLSRLPEPKIANFSQLHQMFFRGRPIPSDDLLGKAENFFINGQNTVHAWQNLIYNYCISSQWQLI
jgi:hypothetical protein